MVGAGDRTAMVWATRCKGFATTDDGWAVARIVMVKVWTKLCFEPRPKTHLIQALADIPDDLT